MAKGNGNQLNLCIQTEGTMVYLAVVVAQAWTNVMAGLVCTLLLAFLKVDHPVWVGIAIWLIYSALTLVVLVLPVRIWVKDKSE